MNDRSTFRILAVDDDAFVLKLLRSMLLRLGYTQVSCHEHSEAALAEISAADPPPQAILLDINMPGRDGVEFVRLLAEQGYDGAVILISGEDESMLRAATMLGRIRGLAMVGSLHKPPSPSQLELLLERCFEPTNPQPRRDGPPPPGRYSPEDVAQGIASGQFFNVYQPQVVVSTGEVVGVETLVRWRHPQDGVVAPVHFIAIAETHGLIGDLTRTVLREAVRQSVAWQEAGLPLRVSINLSMDNLADIHSADMIASETLALGAQPPTLVLEVTESRLMRDLATVLDVLARLHLKRFRLSIDDFGTGHSSLVTLRDLLFDELKIDAGFVHNAWRNERLASFFMASLDLARHLDMEAVAEGVEDAQDWAFVRANRCHLAQGYFIARPMPAAELPVWLRQWRSRIAEGLLLKEH